MGIYPSRSEAIRVAIRDFLNENLASDPDSKTCYDFSKEDTFKSEIARLLRKLREETFVA